MTLAALFGIWLLLSLFVGTSTVVVRYVLDRDAPDALWAGVLVFVAMLVFGIVASIALHLIFPLGVIYL